MSAVTEPVPWTAPSGAAALHAGLGSRAELLGRAFALGADAFALVLDGSPEDLWRRGAGALWSLDPGAGALPLRCSFGAAVLVDPEADAVAALVLAEDRLANQRNRAPSVAERYGELILAILRAQQPETSEHALDVAELAAGVAARLGVDPFDRALVRRAAELHDVGKIAIDPAIVAKPGRLDDDERAQMRRHTIIGDELVAETLGFDAVVVNLYRKAWDDFIVSTVHGDESLRAALLGATYSWEDWESTLSERFRHGGAYLVYDGEIDWEQQSGKRIVADIETIDAPDAWRVEDEIFVPFHHADGTLLGILNVGSPTSGIRPSDEDLEVLTLVVRHAARAVQRAQDAANDAAHRRGLEELLRVSSKLSETVSPSAVLQAICSGISQGLGFERVLVQLRAEDSDLLVSAAGVGIETDDVSTRFVLHDADLERLLDPAFETQGCYLLPLEQAKRRVPSYHDTFPSVANGRGPAAWDRHWLVVPLVDRTGARLGAVFADDPTDRLLPTRERLQALRLFANQATSALESSAQYETMRYLADRDPLTKLLNRRAFVRRLEDAAGRARLSGRPLSLLYCDLDGFKTVNDTRGHAEGDRVLCAFGRLLVATVRHDDAVFRMGGDEFALVLEHCSRERALEVVERVVERLHAERGTGELPIGASFGVAVADCSGPVDSEALLRRADDAMYDAKGSRAVLRVAA